MGRVLIAGSINMDVVVETPRFPKVGETVAGTEVDFLPGGKGANQAVAAARGGAEVAMIGRLGLDAFGREMRAFLAGEGVDTMNVRETGNAGTGVAAVLVSGGDNSIVVVPGANGLVSPADVSAVALQQGDVLVSQFEIPVESVEAFLSRGRVAGARTVLNPAPIVTFPSRLLDAVDVLVVNEIELASLAGVDSLDPADEAGLVSALRKLQRGVGQIVCVTRGRHGATALSGGDVVSVPGRPVEVVDTTGAGDCFVGNLAARLCAGAGFADAARHANAAASISVGRLGAGRSMPLLAEVEAALGRG